MTAWAFDIHKVKLQRSILKLVSLGQVILDSSLVADSDKFELTGTQQAKILFLSSNPDNTNIKFNYNSSAGDMPISDTRATDIAGGNGMTMNWEADRADQVNVNSPLYIDADHWIQLSTAGTVNFTIVIYQITEL